jgi:hypothetical protein
MLQDQQFLFGMSAYDSFPPRLPPELEGVQIGACSEARTLAQAKDVFRRRIDYNFTYWGLDVPGAPTPAMCVQMRSKVENSTYH